MCYVIIFKKIMPICKNDNTYKQINVKDIINNNKTYNKNWYYKSERDYSNFDWTSLYVNAI